MSMNRFQKFLKIDARLRWLKETYPIYFVLLSLAVGLVFAGLVLLILFLVGRR
jgi:hypothetical protein